jgi:hypothetical protein
MENTQRLTLGFSMMDACDGCGDETTTSWISSETVSIYLCRSCLNEAIARTYAGGEIPSSDRVLRDSWTVGR